MNVLIVVPWDQTFGGVAGVVNNLARQLVAAGHRVTFFHANTSSVLLTRGSTKVGFPQIRMLCLFPSGRDLSWRGLLASLVLFPSTLVQLLWMLRRERIDVVNVHYPGSQAFFALCRLLTPIKLVTSVHGADIFPNGVARDHYSWARRLLLNRSDVIVANSVSFREDFLGVFPHFRDKTTFIHNGVDWEELHPPTIPTPPDIGPYVLCVAAHNQKKALEVLLQAFAKVARKNAAYKLMLVGDGPLRADLEKLAVDLQLNERVIFAGQLERREVVIRLHGCTVFVLPSRSEPFGIAIAEAMACGKPVVGSRVGGIPEIVDDGQDGLLVEPDNPAALAEAIRRLASDESLRKKLGSQAVAKIRDRFLWEHTGAAYQRLFSELGRIGQGQTSNNRC
jgi:glycosyltransferase involved in cell wall biosynthesis